MSLKREGSGANCAVYCVIIPRYAFPYEQLAIISSRLINSHVSVSWQRLFIKLDIHAIYSFDIEIETIDNGNIIIPRCLRMVIGSLVSLRFEYLSLYFESSI